MGEGVTGGDRVGLLVGPLVVGALVVGALVGAVTVAVTVASGEVFTVMHPLSSTAVPRAAAAAATLCRACLVRTGPAYACPASGEVL